MIFVHCLLSDPFPVQTTGQSRVWGQTSPTCVTDEMTCVGHGQGVVTMDPCTRVDPYVVNTEFFFLSPRFGLCLDFTHFPSSLSRTYPPLNGVCSLLSDCRTSFSFSLLCQSLYGLLSLFNHFLFFFVLFLLVLSCFSSDTTIFFIFYVDGASAGTWWFVLVTR